MTMIETMQRAMKDELRRQDVLYEDGPDGDLMMYTGQKPDLAAVCRAVLSAMREPTDPMVKEIDPKADYPWWMGDVVRDEVWPRMIDAAVNET